MKLVLDQTLPEAVFSVVQTEYKQRRQDQGKEKNLTKAHFCTRHTKTFLLQGDVCTNMGLGRQNSEESMNSLGRPQIVWVRDTGSMNQFVVADGRQRSFQQPFTWLSIGIALTWHPEHFQGRQTIGSSSTTIP